MNKYLFSMLTVALGLLTSCSQDTPVIANGNDADMTIVSIGLSEQALTRGITTPAAFADPALTNVDVTLIVAYDGKVVYSEQKTAQDLSAGKTVSYKVRFVKGQEYDVMAWADFGKGYYTLATNNGDVPMVTLTTNDQKSLTADANYNLFDAYFQNKHVKITETSAIALTLTRPFALVKVNTTDWNLPTIKQAGLRPTMYLTEIQAPTKMNLITGVTDAVNQVKINAYISEFDQDGNPKELHFDYLFSDTISSILPEFKVTYSNSAKQISDYTFTNIPVQRNYKTIISGNILTKEGDISITLDNSWDEPDLDIVQD